MTMKMNLILFKFQKHLNPLK